MSIYENIKLGNSMASEKEVYEAAKMVGCHDFIERLPDKYHIVDTKFAAPNRTAH